MPSRQGAAAGQPTKAARPALSLKGHALRLLGQREHSRAELERKLAEREQVPGELTQVLDELQAKGFIDERRVVESLLHRRASGFGSARIRQDLLQKGVAVDRVQATLRDLQASEHERALALWRKRFGGAGVAAPADPRERARQARYLASRGFAAETVRRVLREVGRAVSGEPGDDLPPD